MSKSYWFQETTLKIEFSIHGRKHQILSLDSRDLLKWHVVRQLFQDDKGGEREPASCQSAEALCRPTRGTVACFLCHQDEILAAGSHGTTVCRGREGAFWCPWASWRTGMTGSHSWVLQDIAVHHRRAEKKVRSPGAVRSVQGPKGERGRGTKGNELSW